MDSADADEDVIDYPQLGIQEVVQQEQYQQQTQNNDATDDSIPTCEFDQAGDEDTIVVDTPNVPDFMLPPYSTSRRSSHAKEKDTSELVRHNQIALESSKVSLLLNRSFQ